MTAYIPSAELAIQLLSAAFLAILFLQSGLDKIIDWKGNLGWLTGHFAESPLKNMVPFMLRTVTLFEVAAGVVSAIGAVMILSGSGTSVAFTGAVLAGLNILMLFFGQRMAKDYVGAATLVPYFLLCLAAIYFLG